MQKILRKNLGHNYLKLFNCVCRYMTSFSFVDDFFYRFTAKPRNLPLPGKPVIDPFDDLDGLATNVGPRW